MSICSIHGCQARSQGVQFFPVPAITGLAGSPQHRITTEQQRLWLEAIRGKPQPRGDSSYDKRLSDLMKTSGAVCPKHFKDGKPADNLDVQNVDWLPNQLIHFRALNKDMVAKVKADLLLEEKKLRPVKPPPPVKLASPKSKYKVPPITRMVTRRSAKIPDSKEDPQPKVVDKTPEKNVESIFLPAITIDDDEDVDEDTVTEVKEEPLPAVKGTKPPVLYKCGAPKCGNVFLNMDAVREHVVSVHTKNKKVATKKITKCGICSQQFDNFKEALEHLNTKHNANLPDESQGDRTPADDVMLLGPPVDKKGQERMRELTQKLEKFDWCQCLECERIYQLFLNHASEDHSGAKAPVEVEPPMKTEEPQQKVEPVEPTDEVDEPFDDAPFEADDHSDGDYFDNDAINLGPVKGVKEATPEPELEPEVLDVEAGSPKQAAKDLPSKEQPNTTNRVFFKVRKDKKNRKIYTCTACPDNNVFTDYNDVTTHFKKHYMKSNDAIRGQITIRPLRRSEKGYQAMDMTEYQCCLCDNVSGTKETALKCIEVHRANGWLDGANPEEVISAQDIEMAGNEIEIDFDGDEKAPFLPPQIDTFTFRCDKCNLRFYSHSEIYEHVKKTHDIRFQVAKVEEVAIKHTLRCKICDLHFELSACDQAIAHRRAEHKFAVVYNGTNITRYLVEADGRETLVPAENVEYYKKDSIVDHYVCLCGREYSEKDAVDACYTRHTTHKQYKCSYLTCRSVFITETAMKNHVARVHEIDPNAMEICDICGIGVHRANAQKHAESHGLPHKKKSKKPKAQPGEHQCQLCGKTFTTQAGVKIHIKVVHQKERRFQCDVCFKRFLYRYNAECCKKKHLGVREFKCNDCGRQFYTSRQCRSHMLSHVRKPTVAKTTEELEQHTEESAADKE